MRRSLVVSLALLAIVRSQAVAQACMGMASYSAGPVQVAGHGSLTDGINSFGASVGYGLPSSVFGNVGIATTSYDGADAALDVGADVGYQMQIGKAQICPVASFGVGSGPDSDDAGLNSSSRSASLSLAIGTAFGTSRMQIVPAVALGVENTKLKVESSLGDFEGSDTHGLAQASVGLVFNSNITVRPSVSIPLGLTGSEPTVGLSVGFNFGQKR